MLAVHDALHRDVVGAGPARAAAPSRRGHRRPGQRCRPGLDRPRCRARAHRDRLSRRPVRAPARPAAGRRRRSPPRRRLALRRPAAARRLPLPRRAGAAVPAGHRAVAARPAAAGLHPGRAGRGRRRRPRTGRRCSSRWCSAGWPFLISGGTGSGKTTLLNALLSLVAPEERLVLVEDASELRPDHAHVVALEARPANIEGAGEVTLRTLVRQALRMRPDRLVVGEVRGAEVVDMLAAMNTGHEGGCATDPRQLRRRRAEPGRGARPGRGTHPGGGAQPAVLGGRRGDPPRPRARPACAGCSEIGVVTRGPDGSVDVVTGVALRRRRVAPARPGDRRALGPGRAMTGARGRPRDALRLALAVPGRSGCRAARADGPRRMPRALVAAGGGDARRWCCGRGCDAHAVRPGDCSLGRRGPGVRPAGASTTRGAGRGSDAPTRCSPSATRWPPTSRPGSRRWLSLEPGGRGVARVRAGRGRRADGRRRARPAARARRSDPAPASCARWPRPGRWPTTPAPAWRPRSARRPRRSGPTGAPPGWSPPSWRRPTPPPGCWPCSPSGCSCSARASAATRSAS